MWNETLSLVNLTNTHTQTHNIHRCDGLVFFTFLCDAECLTVSILQLHFCCFVFFLSLSILCFSLDWLKTDYRTDHLLNSVSFSVFSHTGESYRCPKTHRDLKREAEIFFFHVLKQGHLKVVVKWLCVLCCCVVEWWGTCSSEQANYISNSQ